MPLYNWVNTFMGICPISFIDQSTYAVLQRYYTCKQFNIQPFPGSYDEQPQEWLFIISIIQDETYKVEKFGRKD